MITAVDLAGIGCAPTISGSVGTGGRNKPIDVAIIQHLLSCHYRGNSVVDMYPPTGLGRDDFIIKVGNLLDPFAQSVGLVFANDFFNLTGEVASLMLLLIVAMLIHNLLQVSQPVSRFGNDCGPFEGIGSLVEFKF